MNYSSERGGPIRSSLPSTWGNQDARSNLAVQPAANSGNIKLKKNAVKIVGPAGSGADTLRTTSACLRPDSPSFTPTPAIAKSKEVDSPVPAKLTSQPITAVTAPKPVSSQTDAIEQRREVEAVLDSLFARLTTQDSEPQTHSEKGTSPIRPSSAVFKAEDHKPTKDASSNAERIGLDSRKPDHSEKLSKVIVPKENPDNCSTSNSLEFNTKKNETLTSSHKDFEDEYLRKASEYLNALPGSKGTTAHTFKAVSQKLRSSYVPDIHSESEEIDKVKKRYVFAITNYVNRVLKQGAKPLTQDLVKQILKDNDGNFLALCATLVEENYIRLDNIDEVVGLCNAILDILPKAEFTFKFGPTTIPSLKSSQPDATTKVERNLRKTVELNGLKKFGLDLKLKPSVVSDILPTLAEDETKQQAIVGTASRQAPETGTTSMATSAETVSPPTISSTNERAELNVDDHSAKLKAWPTQERRENPAGHRTCILKRVSGITSINQLQTLVWGGRLESITMPEPGSDFAVVRFLTPGACQTYFEATENGIKIEIAGAKNKLVFVEKAAGPTSINDIIQNCIDNNETRCIRAIGADLDDWSDVALRKLALGSSQMKREIDRIKCGKNKGGHNFVEFRFANVYHALSFRRQLEHDQDWEHCTIRYAPDPCETARGVHSQEDEDGGAAPHVSGSS